MNAAQSRLDGAAGSIARRSIETSAGNDEGPATPAPSAPLPAAMIQPQPGTSLETDVVDQLAAKNQFLANLAVFKTGDEMLGTLLDAKS